MENPESLQPSLSSVQIENEFPGLLAQLNHAIESFSTDKVSEKDENPEEKNRNIKELLIRIKGAIEFSVENVQALRRESSRLNAERQKLLANLRVAQNENERQAEAKRAEDRARKQAEEQARMIALNEINERLEKAKHEELERQAKTRAKENEAKRLAEEKERERRAAENEAARLASLTPNARVDEKAKTALKNVTQDEIAVFKNSLNKGMLEEIKLSLDRNRNLAHVQFDITTLSGHKNFERVTGFQYAVLMGDLELWNMFIEADPFSKTFLSAVEAYDQLLAVLGTTETLRFFDSLFNPLLNAYEFYIPHYGELKWGEEFDEQKSQDAKSYWCKLVGEALKNMPAWFIYGFSEEGLFPGWPKRKLEKHVIRDVVHLSAWSETQFENGKCGDTFAFSRENSPHVSITTSPTRMKLLEKEGVWIDRDNTVELKKLRTQQLEALKEKLILEVSKNVMPRSSSQFFQAIRTEFDEDKKSDSKFEQGLSITPGN